MFVSGNDCRACDTSRLTRPAARTSCESPKWKAPRPAADEVLIAVEAAGISHADVMQREGKYPPPPGASPILGLEVAGTIALVGERVYALEESANRVCALTNGGGYAEYVAVPAGQVLPIPAGWSAIEAADPAGKCLHRLRQPLHARAIARARNPSWFTAGTSGIGHDRDHVRKRAGRDRHRNRRHAGKVRRVHQARSRARDRLPNFRLCRGGEAAHARTRRRRRPRHRGRRLRRPKPRKSRARRKNRLHCDAGRQPRRARSTAALRQARRDHGIAPARAHVRREGRDRARARTPHLVAAYPSAILSYPSSIRSIRSSAPPKRTLEWNRARTSARSC